MEDNKAKLVTEIGIAEKELKLQQDLVKWHGEERQRLLASIENDKEDLAAMQYKTNVFKDSFSAGREALEAGFPQGFRIGQPKLSRTLMTWKLPLSQWACRSFSRCLKLSVTVQRWRLLICFWVKLMVVQV